uniref:Uncharacterized protein n=1 Tax=Trichuris muris TaxID=70415 RepID=A0A5S6QXJ7_TRIMR
MGNRHATTATSVTEVADGRKSNDRSTVVVVPADADDRAIPAVGNDSEKKVKKKKKKKKGTILRQRSLAPSEKNQKRKKRFQSKSSSPMPRKDLSSATSRQVSLHPYYANGLSQQHLFYPHPMTTCYYPPGAMWQQVPSPWLPKGYGLPLEQRSFFPSVHARMPAPPRSHSVEALCDQPTLRRHTSSVDFPQAKTSTALRGRIGESPSEPGGRLFKFNTSLRPHLVDALPKSQNRPPSAASGRSIYVEELDVEALDCPIADSEHKAKAQPTLANGLKSGKQAEERTVVVTTDAQTIMERNARLLAEAEKMERASDLSKQSLLEEEKCSEAPVSETLVRQQSLSDAGSYPLGPGMDGSYDKQMNSHVQFPVKQLYFGSSEDRAEWSSAVSVGNDRRSVEQADMDKSAADSQTPTADMHSEIDFSWIADLESRLDRSSDQISRAREPSMDGSSISFSTVGQRNRTPTSSSGVWCRDDSALPAAQSGLAKVVSANSGRAGQQKQNGYASSLYNDCAYTNNGPPRRFAMWKRAPEVHVPVYIPEPDYD